MGLYRRLSGAAFVLSAVALAVFSLRAEEPPDAPGGVETVWRPTRDLRRSAIGITSLLSKIG
jgi:hypothetical protein